MFVAYAKQRRSRSLTTPPLPLRGIGSGIRDVSREGGRVGGNGQSIARTEGATRLAKSAPGCRSGAGPTTTATSQHRAAGDSPHARSPAAAGLRGDSGLGLVGF